MTKFKILTLAATLLALTACSKETTSDIQNQMDEAKAKSVIIQESEIKAQDPEPTKKTDHAEAVEQKQLIQEEVRIPISDKSDKGSYFLTSKEKIDNGFIFVYKRVGLAQTTFSKYEINCSTKKMRTLGEGVDSADKIHDYDEKGEWFAPVAGASTGDAAKLVCAK